MTGIGCLTGIMIDPSKLSLIIVSLFFAVTIFIILKKYSFSTKSRVFLIYGHLTFLFFPIVLFTMHTGCGVLCMPCQNNMLHLISYALPTTLIASTLVGVIAIPALYTFSGKKMTIDSKWIIDFVKRHSKKLNIRMPRLYAIDNMKPVAFSFRSFISAIFVSVGLLEIMNDKEIKAVLLHELAHIKEKSSILKISDSLLRFFSPLSLLTRFHQDSKQEEKKADDFAIENQGTDKYLLSAKRKLDEYEEVNRKTNL